MKTYQQIFDPSGSLVNRHGIRVRVEEPENSIIIGFSGFNPRVHVTRAETLADAIAAFRLNPYVAPTPKPAAPRSATKLTIKRRLEDLGKWETFKAVLESMPATVRDEWTLAQEIREDDPMFVANRDAIVAALGITSDQLSSLFDPA